MTTAKKTIYLAGKVTGLPAEQVQVKFDRKEEELKRNDVDVVNPVRLVECHNQSMNMIGHSWALLDTWEKQMRFCIVRMMTCDEVHMLPCWKESRGAILERDIAMRLGMHVVYH